uniref:DUF4100 domain-containing protein n=1 Tax=Mycena chlorophos TaxID=658473 RepID=A0ABQ0LC20_MYCCL|nr:predicted protein [Mycena chlorophos]
MANATNINTTLHVPMPIACSQNAPFFNGKWAEDFLDQILQHAANAGITDDDELVDYIFKYSSDRVKENIRYIPELDKDTIGRTWNKAKETLLTLYPAADDVPQYTEQNLTDFCESSATKASFKNKSEVQTYYRDFMQIAAPLKKKSIIDDTKQKNYFVSGIPTEMKEWFLNQIPEANRKRSAPPTLASSIAALNKRFDTDSITYEAWKSPDRVRNTVSFDLNGNRIDTGTTSTATEKAPGVSTRPQFQPNPLNDPITELTRQMEEMKIHLARLQSGNASNPSQQIQRTGKACFMCGLVDTHPLHPSRCNQTALLLSEGLIKLDTDRNRYVMMNGLELPMAPRGQEGGVAAYIRALYWSTASEQAGPAPRTNSMQLAYGSSAVLGDRFFADTAPRYNPIRQPEERKKTVPERMSGPGPSAPTKPAVPAPAPNRAPPVNSSIPPPPNLINRQDGWKNARAPRNAGNEDIVMRDAKKPGNDKYHITSSIQERANPSGVFESLLQMNVTLPLFELLGSSPPLQKLFSDSTRARREYTSNQILFQQDAEPDQTTEYVTSEAHIGESDFKQIFTQSDTQDVGNFLIRYGNAVAQVPDGRYYAMSTGALTIQISDQKLTAMIDSGSELNLASFSVPGRCGLAVDFEGMKWALKGIHGNPEQLRGCATNVPMRIGRHEFTHHLFISHQELGPQDLILRQPFLQWFAARMDYDHVGAVSLYLWREEGNRKVPPTIVISITDPSDPRNATAISRGHAAYIEDVTDEEDDASPFRR